MSPSLSTIQNLVEASSLESRGSRSFATATLQQNKQIILNLRDTSTDRVPYGVLVPSQRRHHINGTDLTDSQMK
jgi:hypothetical protein